MELRSFLDMLRRRALVIILVVVVVILVLVQVDRLQPPVYTATSTVRVLWDTGLYDASVRESVADRIANTYKELGKSGPVLEEAVRRVPAASSLSAQNLAEQVSVEVVPESQLISISVDSDDAALARDLANALGELVIDYGHVSITGTGSETVQIVEQHVVDLEMELRKNHEQLAAAQAEGAEGAVVEGLTRMIRQKEDAYRRLLDRAQLIQLYEAMRGSSLKVVVPASLPEDSSNSLGLREIGLGLVVGLFAGIGLALAFENLDTRILSLEELERLSDLPVLAAVPRGLLPPGGPGPAKKPNRTRPLEEAYHQWSVGLHALQEDHPWQTLLITSATPKSSSSTVTASLASAVALAGGNLLLVDADLRQPSLHRFLDLSNRWGLTSVLDGEVPVDEVVQDSQSPKLKVLTSGPPPANLAESLMSSKMAESVDEMARIYDVVLLHAPSIAIVSDAAMLARVSDGAILLVHERSSREEQVREAVKKLQAAHADILGLVFVKKRKK